MLPTSPACRHAARILPGSRPPSRSAPASIPIALAAQPVPNFPRLRALALFGRRTAERAESLRYCRRPKTCTEAAMSRCSKLHRYSITSSARASSVGGTSSLSALAVLRLTTSSSFVANCTGKSAGFAPLRIWPVKPPATRRRRRGNRGLGRWRVSHGALSARRVVSSPPTTEMQVAPPHHSITSSAATSSLSGTVRPSILAV